jgi:hypothetical protein
LVRKSALRDIQFNITNIVEKACGNCEKQHFCWYDYETGIWSKKDLICDDIRRLLEHPQVFDISLPSAQEYDLAIRLSRKWKIRTVPEILMIQNASEGQISENWSKKIRGILALWIKNGRDYRILGIKGCILNHLKNIGIIILFFFGFIFGNKMYKIIIPIKRIYEDV